MVKKTDNMTQLSLLNETIDCRFYTSCTAPLCPRDINLGGSIWFPNEPICRLRNVPDWVRKQKRIAKLKNIETNKYFSVRMLDSIQQIHKGLQGEEIEQTHINKSRQKQHRR